MKVLYIHGNRLKLGPIHRGRSGGLLNEELPDAAGAKRPSSGPIPSIFNSAFGDRSFKLPAWFNVRNLIRTPVTATILGAMLLGSQAPAQENAATVSHYIGNIQQVGAPLADVAADYATQVSATTAARLRPEALFDQVLDGELIVKVPLRPGQYRVAGSRLTVAPGTTVYATIEIENGRLVPYADREGTRIQLTKVIDGPAWTKARGIYLKSKSGGLGQPIVDMEGWFDQALTDPTDLTASTMIRRLMNNTAAVEGAGDIPLQMIDFDQLQFQLKPVRMGTGVVNLGGVVLDFAQGSNLSIHGTLDSAQLTGRFALDDAQIRQPGLRMDLGRVNVEASFTSRKLSNGQVHVQGGLRNMSGTVDRVIADQSGRNGTRAHLDLSNVRLNGARLDITARLGGFNRGNPSVLWSQERFSGFASGQIGASTVRVRDRSGTADLDFSANRFEGHLDIGPDNIAIEGELTDADFSVQNFQERSGAAYFDVTNATAHGDAKLHINTDEGVFDARISADRLKADFKDLSTAGDTPIDLGATHVEGSGELWIGPQRLKVSGDIDVKGVIDDLVVRPQLGEGVGPTVLDVAAGSTVQGKLRLLEISPNAPLRLDLDTDVNLTLERHTFKLPGLETTGTSQLVGEAKLVAGDNTVRMTEANLLATMSVEDGEMAGGNGALALDLAHGSSLQVSLTGATLAAGERPQFQLGPGSQLVAKLDSGHIDMAKRRITFLPDTEVRFDLARIERGPDGFSELVGSLLIDAPLQVTPIIEGENLGGFVGEGGVGIRVDGVRLDSEGRFSLEGVDVSLDGQMGPVERIVTQPKSSPLTTLLLANPDLVTHQHLINHFYGIGGDWAGAQRAALAYGLKLNDLVSDPDAALERPEAPPQIVPAELSEIRTLSAEVAVPDLATIQNADAAKMLGLDIDPGGLNLIGLAKTVSDGDLTFTVPLEGTYGSWPNSVSFKAGTVLTVRARAEGGQIVDGSFEAKVSKSGNAFWWSTLEGAYLDEDRNLTLDIWGWGDQHVEGFDALPTDLSSLIERFTAPTAVAGGNADISSVADLSKAEVRLDNVTFEDGQLDFGIGHLGLTEDTKLSVVGQMDEVRIEGQLATDTLAVDTRTFALDATEGTASVKIVHTPSAEGGGRTVFTFEDLDLAANGLVYRSDQGDLTHLGEGRAQGRVKLTVDVDMNNESSVGAEFHLDSFNGDVVAIRVPWTEDPNGGFLALGPTHFSGMVVMGADYDLDILGQAKRFDARLIDVVMPTAAGDVMVSDARLQGQGVIILDGDHIAFLRGPLAGKAVVSADELELKNVFPGYLENISSEDGTATLQFDLEHVERVEHGPEMPFVLKGARGRVGGAVRLENLDADVEADPLRSGIEEHVGRL